MEFGLANGLAQDMQFDQRINDERFRNMQMERAKANAAASAKAFADDFSQGPIGSKYDDALISEYTRKRMQDAVQVYKNYPNWKYNPDALAQLKAIKDDIKGNEHVQRGIAFVDAKKRLNADLAEMAKNPQMHDQEAYQNLIQQVNNYNEYGNQFGPEAAQKEGAKTFVYQKPQDFVDLPQTLLKAGNSIKNYDVIKPKGGNIGEYYTEPKANEIEAIKNSIYQQHGRQIQVEARKLGFKTPEQVDQWLTQGIAAGFNKHYSIGDANAQFNNYIQSENLKLHKAKAAREMETNPSYTPYDYLTDKRNIAGQINPQDIEKVWGNKPLFPLNGNNGAKVDLDGFDVNYTGKYIQKQGMPFFLGKIHMPLDIAEEKGIYKEPFGPDLGRSGKITPEFLDKARIQTGVDKEGKPMKYVEVDYELPINVNDKVARDKFNTFVLPDKLVEPGTNPFGSGKKQAPAGAMADEKGQVFTADGKYIGTVEEFQ